MYCLCVIIGAGIYVLIGIAAGEAGNGIWISFFLAALIAGCTGLSYAELSSKFPFDSAEYTYCNQAFGSKRIAFGIAWLKLVTAMIAAAVVSLGFGGYLSGLLGTEPITGALGILFLALLINLYGVKSTIRISAFLVAITIIGLLLVIFSSAGYIGSVDYFDFQLGWGGIFGAAALIFFAFIGFEDVANLSQETKNPKKVLPKAIIISIIVSTILYTVVSLVCVSVIPWQVLANSHSPLTDVVLVTMGPLASTAMSFIALTATGSTVFILLFAYSRMILGMAEKKSLPSVFTKISRRFGSPYIALIFVFCLTALFVFFENMKFIASLTNFGVLFVFATVNLSLIVLRYKRNDFEDAYNVPLNIGRFPVIPAIGGLFSLYMLTKLSLDVAVLSMLLLAAGIIIFSVFIKPLVK
ncbi:MAG: amino acid permease [Candidatus Diapherotrites archaeon]|nr:amino acid permease [Candidatus Diapherotrites archaeon]